MTKNKLFLLPVLLASLAVAVFAGGKKESSPYPLGEYDISYNGSTCASPIVIAVLKGFFEEEGVKINLVSGSSFEVSRTALASGKMAVQNGDFQYFPAVHNGIDVKLVGGLHEGCIKILAPKSSGIASLEDLRNRKGVRFAVDEIGGTPMSVASVAVGSVGLDPQADITWLPFPADQEVQAVESGAADILAAWDPFATIAENTGNYTVLVDIKTHPLFKDRSCCFTFGSGKLVRDNPGAIAAILRAINRAADWIGHNPEEAARLLITEKKIATDDVALVAGLLNHYAYTAHTGAAANAHAKDDAVYFARLLTQIGYLPADLDPQKFVDDLYVDIFALEAAASR
ncbi:MAG: ABC transporter substrate-binding protein [Spirochaetaceae bacterium]|jgi:NitT/TauT family transport system substrate-binding protein|nr:ABC transporter substrate-binding protein [Spirochaetaceae bacterium]